MNRRWSDFLFSAAVRLICGLLLGAMMGLFFGWRIILRHAARNEGQWTILWLAAWSIGGAAVSALTIPYWQRPWYRGANKSEHEPTTRATAPADFRRVAPELYNRAAHPSPKQYHDFVQWLRQATAIELQASRGDAGDSQAALAKFFARGAKAGLALSELIELLPSIFSISDLPEAEKSQVLEILRSLDLEHAYSNENPGHRLNP